MKQVLAKTISPAKRDELAKLAWAFAQALPKGEAKREVASMFRTQFDCTEDFAWALIVRGKSLAKALERAV